MNLPREISKDLKSLEPGDVIRCIGFISTENMTYNMWDGDISVGGKYVVVSNVSLHNNICSVIANSGYPIEVALGHLLVFEKV